jgi:hypothetical protein
MEEILSQDRPKATHLQAEVAKPPSGTQIAATNRRMAA